MTDQKLVLVEWVDSRRPTPEWQRLDGWKPDEICECVSVGWEIGDFIGDPGCLVLAPNMADVKTDDMQVSGIIHIPRKLITRIVDLEETK